MERKEEMSGESRALVARGVVKYPLMRKKAGKEGWTQTPGPPQPVYCTRGSRDKRVAWEPRRFSLAL